MACSGIALADDFSFVSLQTSEKGRDKKQIYRIAFALTFFFQRFSINFFSLEMVFVLTNGAKTISVLFLASALYQCPRSNMAK